MRRPAKRRSERPSIEDVIVRRILFGEPRSRRRHEVRIGRPAPDPRGDWRCAYHIGGIGMRTPRYGFGVDAMQALLLTLGIVRVRLEVAEIAWHWEGGEPGNHGFPRHVPTEFGLALSRRIDRLIDRELASYFKKLGAKARNRSRRRVTR